MAEMKKILFFVYLLINILACGSGKRTINREGIISSTDAITIKLNPEPNNSIKFSEIIQDIKIVPLESTPRSLLSTINKLEIEDNMYFVLNDYDRLVYVFDAGGNYINTIGRKGRGPGEVLLPSCFAIDRINKEVVLTDDFSKLLRFDYSGKYIESKPIDITFYDFLITNSGEKLYHTSKRIAFNPDGSTITYNLWVDKTGEGDFSVYFPYDYEFFPNGSTSFETKRAFSVFGDTIRYHYLFSNLIYTIDNGDISKAYNIDFGNKKANVDFNKMNHREALEYILQDKQHATFIQDVIESENWLRFNYLINQKRIEVFYDKINCRVAIESNIIDDIFSTEMLHFIAHRDNQIIGCVIPEEVNLTDNIKQFVDDETFKVLKELTKKDNPFLIEITPKLQ